MSGGPLRLRRIQWRLPLSVAGLLLGVVAAFSWLAYHEVRETSVEAAAERLDEVARRLSQLLGSSVERRLAETRDLAADPHLVAAVAVGDSTSRAEARRALTRLLESSDQVMSLGLLDAEGRPLLTVERPGASAAPAEGLPTAWNPDDTGILGEVSAIGDTVWYSVAAPIRTGASPVGTLIQRRRISSPQARQMITDLIGMEARLLVGEPGGTWTDLQRAVAGPPTAAARADGPTWIETVEGRSRIGVGRPVPGASWRVWVDFPEDLVLARSRAFLGRILPLGLVVVAVGGLLGWLLSRRVTVPLGGIAAAARALAGGEYGRRLPPGREDELGEVAAAFNMMAQRVEDSHTRLARQVEERTEALERHAADLKVANRELEAFCYSVSHDLRAPLRAIHGFSDALLEDYQDALDAEGEDYLRRVCRAADRMGLLIDDLLHLSRVARSEVQPEEIDLSALAEEILGNLREEEPGRHVEASVEPGVRATGDRNLLRVALANLLGNAWKFTAKREDAFVQFGARANGEGPVFFVRDNGAGFDMAHAENLFGPFQRLHGREEFAGTGVGLATVQRVIHRHGGRIWAEAAPGEGASFYFTLSGGAGGVSTTHRERESDA